jgi:Xaa-Pro dipeptidase
MSKYPGEGNHTPKEELLARIAALKSAMVPVGIDFALIMQNADLFYFTGSIQKGILVVPLDEDPLFLVQRSLDRAREESPLEIIGIRTDKEAGALPQVKKFFKGRGGLEFDVVPVALFERMKSITAVEDFVDLSGIIRGLRMVKSPFEIEQIKGSGAICDFVHARAREIISEGMREIDIDAELVAEGRRRGHQGFLRMRGFNQEMMNLYVTSGYTGTVSSAADVPVSGIGISPAIAQGSSMKMVEKGVPVIVDYGGGYNGYITDETRSYVIGSLDELFRRSDDVSRSIVEDIEAFGKEGVDATELYRRAITRVRKADLGAHFMGFGDGQVSFIGHGVGLEINELPVITARHHTVLKEGMVFALEPKFVFPGKGVIGVEVDFIVRKDRLERVTSTPIDLVRL